MRTLVLVMLAGCLHSPPFVGISGGDDDASIIMDAAADANEMCPGGQSIGYTGAPVLVRPPGCANAMTIDAYGAGGGNAQATNGTGAGGKGGHVIVTISIPSGQTYYVGVGKSGGMVTSHGTKAGNGGYNGGGNGGDGGSTAGGGGGGATDVRTDQGLETRIIVVGGGGGATTCKTGDPADGGIGGGTRGGDAGKCTGATSLPDPGSQNPPGGSGLCNNSSGLLGQGGAGCSSPDGGGGGGGGYYGGGGGQSTGGAGGSSYISQAPGVNAVVIANSRGDNSDDGRVTIMWITQ